MDINKLINIFVTITLIEMMISIGLGVTFSQVITVLKSSSGRFKGNLKTQVFNTPDEVG